jgi:WD40 repeat protein
MTPDGLRAVSVSQDKTLQVFELEKGRCLARACLSEQINSVALSPRLGQVIVGTSTGQTLKFTFAGSG